MHDKNDEKTLVEDVENKLEILMSTLPSENLERNRIFLGGWIDCLFDQGIISEEIRGEIYVKYVG